MKSFLEAFAENAGKYAEKTAIVDQSGSRETSYRELDVLSDKIAGLIVEKKVEKGSLIPVLMGREMEFIASMLAILKAGCAFVPLSSAYPQERIDYITNQCKADWILGADFVKDAAAAKPLAEPVQVSQEDPAFAVYTSGSTGTPKGILHDHRSLSHSSYRIAKATGCLPEDQYLSNVPYHFVAFIIDLTANLYTGNTIHIQNEQDCRDVRKIEQYIAEHQINATFISPQLLKLFHNKSDSLRYVTTGSERLSGASGQGYTLYNFYGASETTPGATIFTVDKEYDNTPIGKPFEGMKIYLLNEDGSRTKEGEIGEICISGPLSRGYIDLSEKTAEVFCDNPFAEGEDDKILYHSNDLGKFTPEGNLIYVNRKDWMVKINGQRVETGEIETLMNSLDFVETAAVKGFENEYGQTYLCGYFQLKKDSAQKDPAAKIKEELKKKLPDYMIPSFFVELEAFPLNVNRKLDRLSLKPPQLSAFKAEYEAPVTPEEELLCKGFEEILGVEKVGRKDDFFALGGDSIKAVRLQAFAEELNLASQQVFEGKTPEKIAALCGQKEEDPYENCREEKDFYPLTDSQMGVFLECLQNPTGVMYNIPFAFTIPEGVDLQRFRQALLDTVKHYPVMGIAVRQQDETYGMVPGAAQEFEIPLEKVSQKQLEQIKESFVRPFDLEKGPLFRMELYETEKDGCLLADMHHIISDGASFASFFSQAARAYLGQDLQPEEITQFDLSNYEQKLKNTQRYQEAEEYFDRLLAGNEVDSNLLFDKDEDQSADHPAKRLYCNLEGRISSGALEHFTRQAGVTENTFFLGAFAYALAKYTGQTESLFTTVNNGRHDPRFQNTVGMLVRTIPVYANIEEDAAVQSFLQKMQADFFETMNHDCCSFGELANTYGISSDILFVYQAETLNAIEIEEARLPMEALETGSSLANITLHVFKKKGSYDLFLEYRSDVYEDETIEAFCAMMGNIMEGFLSEPCLKDIALIDEEEGRKLDRFHGAEVVYDRSETIIDLFNRRAAEMPEHTAVIYKDKRYTYAQADELSDRVAGYVQKLGIGREQVVSVLIPRCEYMPIASLGIMKAGAAYQPLDPTYPAERLAFMMKDAQASLLIADEQLLELVPEYDGPVLLLKDIPTLPLPEKESLTPPSPEDLYILLYTSGTTGTPKGCMLLHKNLRAFCQWYWNYYDLKEENVVAAYASYGFDACMMDMYPALTRGAAVCIVPEELRLELTSLSDYFEQENVTHSFMTTQVGRQFAEEGKNKSLKHLSVGGETLVPLQTEAAFELYNAYGPTECTIFTTIYRLDKTRRYSNVPIGRPMDNMELYIVDKYGRRVPTGATGELCVAGYQVSRGYLNRPEQTEKVFTPNPFSSKEGFERIYHTGDMVRFLADGNLQFVGRRDSQVKIRGFRVELTEIERVIRQYPGVKDATVMAFDAPAGGKAVAAYVVGDEKIDVNGLSAFIMEEKPPYMVPSVTMQIDQIPLNQNMKVNKRALPDPKPQAEAAVSDDNRPMTLLETDLKAIISQIVGHEGFSVSTNLMNAGLTSLSAIKLAAAVQREYGVELEVKKMMKQCTILSIEDEIYLALRQKRNEEPAEEKAVELKEWYPLTQTQLGVYYDAMKDSESTAYNIPAMFSFPASVTAAQLKKAAETVIAAHPYINTRIRVHGEEYVQMPYKGQPEEIPLLSMTEAELAKYKAQYVKPFVILDEPLYRLSIVETEARTCLFADFHHIICDGGSLDLFMHQLAAVLGGEIPEKETFSYYDFAAREKEQEHGEHYLQGGEFFAKMLENCRGASELAPDLSGQEQSGRKEESTALCDGLKVDGFCREHSVTPAQLFLAAAFYTLSRYLSSKDIYLCTISNGRSDLKLQNAMGMFVKTLPLAANVEGSKTVLRLIEEASQVLGDAVSYEEYPFTKIAADYDFAPQIMYACQLGVLELPMVSGQPVELDSMESDHPKFKLSIHIEERDGNPAVCLQYNNALYSRELMDQLALSMAVCVERMMEEPSALLGQLSLVTEEQQARLDKFRQAGSCELEEKVLHRVFEKQVALHKEKTALIAAEGSYTYEQLNAQMNRVANGLAEHGFSKGDTAAILLGRTGALMIAMYGVMKAGGAYIPCDPEYPAERIRQITEDSQAAFVITTAERLGDFAPGRAIDIQELLTCENTDNPKVEVSEKDLAYMIYTSGSTGKPKGVMLEHGGIANYVYDHEANPHVHACVTCGSVMMSITTVSFDMALKETAVALCNGLTLVLANEDDGNHPAHLAALMEKTGADIFNATPSRMLQYMESLEFCQALARCKVVMSGGEQYSLKLLEKLKEVTDARIFNTYGPTEITVSCNAKELTCEDRITIGRPLLNYTEYVVDSNGNLLPPGVVGELYIGGMGVARGYHDLPEMTAERFVEFNGERIYKSGDYARWTDEGDIVILGRTDHQVKLRGLRIELEEIENCIAEYPQMKAVVVVIRKINETEHLCAYYTAGETISVEALKEALAEKLTKYMIPTAYRQLDEMPMTPNGKIDRKQLPEPELAAAAEYVKPTTKAEEVFCKIFAEVLEMDQVGIDDSFFDLGGTSLVVTRVIIAATEAGFDITYGDVFSHPTPRKLAALFQEESGPVSELADLSLYDYANIENVLKGNNLEAFQEGEMQPLGNILLTGATGFLGIHILREFLLTEEGKAHCILRKGRYNSAEDRLKSMLFYYFEDTFEELIGKRLFITEGDVTGTEAFDRLQDCEINTVINCAANVKHFSSGTDIEDVNVGGALNCIAYCKETGSRLVHISTTSVSGFSVGGMPPEDTVMSENMLYFGQALDTKYGHSKFLAERAILEEVSQGLSAKIMRVGNLSARDTDGEFQMNFSTNSFVGRLKSYELIGRFPYTMMDSAAEMAPIDSTSQAILQLAKTPKACCLFHPYNNHSIYMGDIIHEMKRHGMDIELAEEKDYLAALEKAQKDPQKAEVLSSMIAYQNMGHGKITLPVKKENHYTMQVLYRLQYNWPTTSKEYVGRFVEALDGLGFFSNL
ncbi:amino acid adenylation domain-containing protein [Anaerovorax odorimutans]|uniref:Amino acid adenylation domain-containing protein n=1 Tax=Anaerovorax odorimutans TaxID=109327 RepID=A0ABT1RKL1_9FIRM|nr:non-ribosomal peptide synthetase [Anaerovorax odorimutans]MCQ4635722.1 amino acid adenylation domain-containing protein [Anaerovorax odorimutans]